MQLCRVWEIAMSRQQSGSFFGGMLLGAAAGAVVGLLLAPRPGRDTRRVLKKSLEALPELLEDVSSSLHLQADRLSDSTLRRWDGTLEQLQEALRAGKAASEAEYSYLSRRSTEAESSTSHDA